MERRAGDLPRLSAGELRLVWCPESLAGDLPRRARVDLLLRQVLAPAVGVSPDSLRFGREAKGRPFLRQADAPDFNLSDTDGGTLVAITGIGRIGVDLEALARRPPVKRLAARWFSAAEAGALSAMDDESARRAFLRLWTAKEASCKSTGTGIFGFLDQWQFDVDSESPSLRALPADVGAAADWQFLRLHPSPAHTAVIALHAGRPMVPTCYRLVD